MPETALKQEAADYVFQVPVYFYEGLYQCVIPELGALLADVSMEELHVVAEEVIEENIEYGDRLWKLPAVMGTSCGENQADFAGYLTLTLPGTLLTASSSLGTSES